MTGPGGPPLGADHGPKVTGSREQGPQSYSYEELNASLEDPRLQPSET